MFTRKVYDNNFRNFFVYSLLDFLGRNVFLPIYYEQVNNIYKYSTKHVKCSYILSPVSVDTIDDCCLDDIAELAVKAKTKH